MPNINEKDKLIYKIGKHSGKWQLFLPILIHGILYIKIMKIHINKNNKMNKKKRILLGLVV